MPFVYPLAVIVATPSYVAYICFVAIRKILDIDYQPEDFNGQLPGVLKFSESTLESETQLILGECKTPDANNWNHPLITQVFTSYSCWALLKILWTRSSSSWGWPPLYSALSRAYLNSIFTHHTTLEQERTKSQSISSSSSNPPPSSSPTLSSDLSPSQSSPPSSATTPSSHSQQSSS